MELGCDTNVLFSLREEDCIQVQETRTFHFLNRSQLLYSLYHANATGTHLYGDGSSGIYGRTGTEVDCIDLILSWPLLCQCRTLWPSAPAVGAATHEEVVPVLRID